MNSSEPKPPNVQGRVPPDEFGEATGLPWFRNRRSVYIFVLGSFLIWVALLYALSVLYP